MHRSTLEDDGSYAALDWRNANWTKKLPPYYVMIRRQTEPILGSGMPVDVTIDGSDEGAFYEGKLPGEASISWVIPNVTSCSTVILALVAPDLSRDQARREIFRIAGSLRGSPWPKRASYWSW